MSRGATIVAWLAVTLGWAGTALVGCGDSGDDATGQSRKPRKARLPVPADARFVVVRPRQDAHGRAGTGGRGFESPRSPSRNLAHMAGFVVGGRSNQASWGINRASTARDR
jgi:hypothetical protein